MSFDAHKNFSYGTVLTAPSPPASGTTLVLNSGEGADFPDPSTDGEYNITIWPTATQPLSSNAEIARVTARSTDTLTITRQQEGTSARTVLVGDQVALTITAKVGTDIEEAANVKSSAYMGSSQLNLTTGSATKVVFDTENYDPGSNYDPVTNYRFTAPADGFYLIHARITWLGSSLIADKRYTMYIYRNGASIAWTFNHASLVTALSSQITEIRSLSATNYIEIYARQDSGVSTVDIDGGSASLSTFDVHLLST